MIATKRHKRGDTLTCALCRQDFQVKYDRVATSTSFCSKACLRVASRETTLKRGHKPPPGGGPPREETFAEQRARLRAEHAARARTRERERSRERCLKAKEERARRAAEREALKVLQPADEQAEQQRILAEIAVLQGEKRAAAEAGRPPSESVSRVSLIGNGGVEGYAPRVGIVHSRRAS